jgi:NADH:ubiquinone oxidoreductase subunit 2 (subunit N)
MTHMLAIGISFWLWEIFMLIWSFIGLTIYEDVYRELCGHTDEEYDQSMMIIFYSNIAIASAVAFTILLGLVTVPCVMQVEQV